MDCSNEDEIKSLVDNKNFKVIKNACLELKFVIKILNL